MACGIYGIKNKVNGKIYIGKSTNIQNRFIRHRTLLKNNKHFNKHLLNAYKKYGKEKFEYIVLIECQPADLPITEQKCIDEVEVSMLYNHQIMVKDLHFDRNPFFGKKHSSSSKQKMSEWKRVHYVGKGNPNYGKKNTIESRIKMSEGFGKLKKEQVVEIANMLRQGLPHQEIADKYDICRTAITRIASGARWSNVTGGPVVPIIYKDGIRQFTETHRQRICQGRKGKLHTEKSKEKIRNARKRGDCDWI